MFRGITIIVRTSWEMQRHGREPDMPRRMAIDRPRPHAVPAGSFRVALQPQGDDYRLFEAPGGGIMLLDRVDAAAFPGIYIDVESIDPFLERAGSLGGR